MTAFAATGVAILIGQRASRAITATWNGTTDSNWSTNTDWSGGTAPGSTSSTTNTDTAVFNNSGDGHTTITVDSNRNIDNITFDTANAAGYDFVGGTLLGTSGGEILMTSSVTQPESFSDSLSIESSKGVFSIINNATSVAATINFGSFGSIQATSGGTLYLGGTNTGQNIIGVPIVNGSGPMNVVVNSSGTWTLGGSDTYTGDTFVTGGTLEIANSFSGFSPIYAYNGASVTVVGTVSNANLDPEYNGIVVLENNGKLSSSGIFAQNGANVVVSNIPTIVDNRLDGAGLGMAGGSFSYLSGTGLNSDQIGAIVTTQGANNIYLDANTGGSTVLTASSINQSTFMDGTLLIVAPKLGATPGAGVTNLEISTAGTGAFEMGGFGGTGSTNISIENFAVVDDNSLTGNAQYNLVTGVGTVNGLRGLAPGEYTRTINDNADFAGTLNNVSLANTTATINATGTTVNAVRLDTNGVITGGGILTVNSGAVLALANNGGISVADLNFGGQEGFIHTIGNLTVSGNITGSAGLTKTGSGTLYFSSPSPLGYTGATALNQGVMRLGAANQLPASSPFYLVGGTLDMNGFNQTLELASGPYAGSSAFIVNSNSSAPVTLTVHAASGAFSQFRGTIGATGGLNNISVNIDTAGIGLLLSHSSDYTGNTTISSGALGLDFSEPDSTSSNILPSTTHVYCGGELVGYQGSTPASQTLNGVTMNPGTGALIETGPLTPSTPSGVLPSASLQISLGALTRTTGGTADIFPGTNGSGFSTSTANTNGIIGGWAALNSQDWAVSTSGDVTAYTGYTNDTWSSGANVTATTNSTQTNATANSLRFGLAQTNTVTLSGICTLSSGGILVDFYNGANVDKIQGGTLKGAAGADLVVNNFDTTANSGLEIDSTIADNTSATALTLAGGGTLTLTAANSYTGGTYINYGTLNISSNANLGSPAAAAPVYLEFGKQSTLSVTASVALDNGGSNPRPIVIGGAGGGISVPTADTVTIDGVISGSAVGTLMLNGNGRVIFSNPANTYAGAVNFGNLLLSNADAAQYMTLENQVQLNFASGIGQFYIGGLAGNSNIGLLNLGSQPINVNVGGNNQSTTYSGNLTANGSFTKSGTGTTALTGQIFDTFDATVNSGTLALGNLASLPLGSNILNNASLVFNTNSTTAGSDVGGNGTTSINSGVSVVLSGFSQSRLINNGTLTVLGTSQIGPQIGTGSPIAGDGTLNIGNSTTTGSVSLVGFNYPSSVGALSISSGSSLNITNDRLYIDYGSGADPIASVAAWIASGYAHGSWNGPGINSTVIPTTPGYGIGYADSADPGNPAGLPSETIEVMYTLLGDANLSGVVDGTDFGIVAANFNKGVTGWDEGDFNYDNVVDGTDFGDLAANFNKGASDAAAEWAKIEAFAAANGLIADIPEPISLGMLTLSAAGILMQRRRRLV